MILLLPFFAILFATPASAADRTIDLSTGCKVYKLANKKWAATDASAFEGVTLKKSQILRDEKFTVFRTPQGVFGVNQKCVIAAEGEPAPRASKPRPTGKRKSAAKPEERVDESASPWAAAFSLGMNLSPSGTVTRTFAGTASTPEKKKFKSSILFMGEASYRVAPYLRVAAEIALSQLQEDSQTGNEISYFDVVPQLLIPAGEKITLYLGPTLGFYFLSQNAQSNVTLEGNTVSVKQQTATSLLIGGVLGGDYRLSEQFDLGLYFRYFKPGDIKVTGTTSAPTAGAFESTLSTSYMAVGARFLVRF